MHIKYKKIIFQQGISLIEMIVFLVVISIAATVIFKSYDYSTSHNVDAIVHIRLLESAQSKLDEVMALKYDANTPSGGIPACNSPTGLVCDNLPDGNMNDVDDFNGYSDSPYPNFTRSVSVSTDTLNNIKLVSVTVTTTKPTNLSITLAAYKANF